MDVKVFKLKKGEKPLDSINPTCGFAGIFRTVGVIGDSLSSGEFESHDQNGQVQYHDMYEYSWPSVLQRITGTRYNNYSRGGMTAKEFVESWADANNFWQPNQAYIIALGNNDMFVFNHPMGSADDVSVSFPDTNPDTFFGNLGRIVSKLKTIQPRARIFLVTPQRRGEPCDVVTEEVARQMAKVCDKFDNVFLVDMTTYGPVYDAEMRADFAMGFHPNAMGYYAYALMIGNYIDYVVRSLPQKFFQLPFVGTDLKNNDAPQD